MVNRVSTATLAANITGTRLIDRELNRVRRGVDRVDRSVRRNTRSVDRQARSYSRLSSQLSRAATFTNRTFAAINTAIIGGAAIGSIRRVVGAFADYEAGLAAVRRTTNFSVRETAQLSKELRRISLDTGVASTELAGVAAIVGQLGIRGVQNVAAFTASVSELNIGTDLTSEGAAFALARIRALNNEPFDQVSRIADIINALGNSLATTDTAIAEFGTVFSGRLSQFDLGTEAVLALAGAFSAAGQEASSSGTAALRLFTFIRQAAREAGDQLAAFSRITGLSGDEFIARSQNDLAQLGFDVITSIGRQADRGQAIRDIGFTDIRSQAPLAALSGTPLAQQAFNTALNSRGSLASEISLFLGLTQTDLRRIREGFNRIGQEAGEALRQPIKEFVAQFNEATIQRIGDFAAGLTGAAVGIGGVATSIISLVSQLSDTVSGVDDSAVRLLADVLDKIRGLLNFSAEGYRAAGDYLERLRPTAELTREGIIRSQITELEEQRDSLLSRINAPDGFYSSAGERASIVPALVSQVGRITTNLQELQRELGVAVEEATEIATAAAVPAAAGTGSNAADVAEQLAAAAQARITDALFIGGDEYAKQLTFQSREAGRVLADAFRSRLARQRAFTIGGDLYAEAISPSARAAASALNALRIGADLYAEAIQGVGETLREQDAEQAAAIAASKESYRGLARSISNSLVGALRGAISATEALGNIVTRVADEIAERLLVQPISDFLVSTVIPAAIGAFGGVPGAATGGVVRRAGLTRVGERGAELVSLPAGAAVYPSGTVPAGGSAPTINIIVDGVQDPALVVNAIQAAVPSIERRVLDRVERNAGRNTSLRYAFS